MSIQGRTITIGKTVYQLEELSIDRTLRLTDIVFRVLEKMSDDVQKEFSAFVDNYKANNDVVITPQEIESERLDAEELRVNGDDELLQSLGDIEPLRTRLEQEGIDPDGLTGPVTVAANPSQEEIIGFFLPKAYQVARPELLTLFALILAENAKMAEAEDQPGGVDAYLESIAKKVKHEGNTDDLIALIVIGWEVAKDEFERIKKSGNLPAGLAGLTGADQASQTDEPTPSI